MTAAAAGSVDSSLAAAHIRHVEELLQAGLSPRGQALANSVLARAVLSNGDLDRAITLCERTLELSVDDPRSRLRLGAYALRAEALALKGGADATWAFREALAPAIELAWWGQIWRYLPHLARWWSMTGNDSAAALSVGWAKANDITVAGLDELVADLSDPSLQVVHQQGARMSRTELLEYVMAELAPVATAGSLTT